VYCVRRQQCSLVNVTPKSGRPMSVRFSSSALSSKSTTDTASNTDFRCSLKKIKIEQVALALHLRSIKALKTNRSCDYRNPLETPAVTIQCNLRVVAARRRDCPKTSAPKAYASLVANVTQASVIFGSTPCVCPKHNANINENCEIETIHLMFNSPSLQNKRYHSAYTTT
jgi:hypothetical protein